MSKAQEIREILEEIERIRREATESIEEVRRNGNFSDAYKAQLIEKAINGAKANIEEINERVEAILPDLEAFAIQQQRFDYNDPKLLAAIQFIQANGNNTPETAWRQMIADFSGKPQELFYLSTLFEKNRLIDGAVAAKEAAQPFAFSAGLPQRLADKIYYVSQADPLAHIDLSAFESDLDAFERVEAAEQIG